MNDPLPPPRFYKDSHPVTLGDVLGPLFVARGWARKTERAQLEDAWAAAVGPEAPQTRVLGLKRGVLEVEVRNAVLMQELAQFRKRSLLSALRAKLTGRTVTDIKFRAGAW
jgi:predicted nucleic acid-binding Zn ribbon protein